MSCPDPNDYSVFQPGAALPDLSSRLLVYYHPKACTATTVYDLSPANVKGKGASAQFSGGCYMAFRLKASARCRLSQGYTYNMHTTVCYGVGQCLHLEGGLSSHRLVLMHYLYVP